METTKHAGGIIPKLLLAATIGLIVPAGLGQGNQPPQLIPNFAGPVLFVTGSNAPRGSARGDIDGDGDMDVVVTGALATVQGSLGSVSVFLNTDNWSPTTDGFEAPVVLSLSGGGDEDCTNCSATYEVVVTQIDGDIYPDIAVTTNTADGKPQLVVFITDPSPPPPKKVGQVFTRYVYQLSSAFTYQPKGLIARDLNNSGRNDFAIAADSVQDPNILSAVFIVENASDDVNGRPVLTANRLDLQGSFSSSHDIVAGKFTDDTFLDLVVCDLRHNSITKLVGDGDLGFQAFPVPGTGMSPPWKFSSIAAGKLNSDNLRDLVCGEDAMANENKVDGANYFKAVDSSVAFEHTRPQDRYRMANKTNVSVPGIAVGNINGGTKRDMIAGLSGHNPYFHKVVIRLGNGDGTFGSERYEFEIEPANGPPASSIYAVLLVDLDGDGFNDIVTTNTATDNISVLMNISSP